MNAHKNKIYINSRDKLIKSGFLKLGLNYHRNYHSITVNP